MGLQAKEESKSVRESMLCEFLHFALNVTALTVLTLKATSCEPVARAMGIPCLC